MKTPQQLHIPVLLDSVVRLLAPKKGETYLDLTAGYGGHATEVISRIGDEKLATLVDRDLFAIEKLREKFPHANVIHSDFAKFVAETDEKFDMVLLDLGVSSVQLDFGERGFSFREDSELDMRMDRSQKLTAFDVVNKYSEKNLAEIFQKYGEEKSGISRKIARELVISRKFGPTKTTGELAEKIVKIVGKSDGGKWHKTHPATKIFQAIRIEVNDELGQLTEALNDISRILKPNGRVAIISFHSLEDRIVKEYFRENDSENDLEKSLIILAKKPIEGSLEDANNPRARSAKLRAARNK
jgi:16S rRNA (cytosine1402-N4)-methyltransferase